MSTDTNNAQEKKPPLKKNERFTDNTKQNKPKHNKTKSSPLDDPQRVVLDRHTRHNPRLKVIPHLLRVRVEARGLVGHEPSVLDKFSEVTVAHFVHLRHQEAWQACTRQQQQVG